MHIQFISYRYRKDCVPQLGVDISHVPFSEQTPDSLPFRVYPILQLNWPLDIKPSVEISSSPFLGFFSDLHLAKIQIEAFNT